MDHSHQEDTASKRLAESHAEEHQSIPEASENKANDMDEEEVKQLLETLNSKNKRKLTRQLERDGLSALKAVHVEALKLIEEMKEKETVVVKEKIKEKKPDPEPASKKRKRDEWAGLSPEERLRREEQRLKQQEAAERRAKGETPPSKHKHSIPSEDVPIDENPNGSKNRLKIRMNTTFLASTCARLRKSRSTLQRLF
jgi:hypothetical protein